MKLRAFIFLMSLLSAHAQTAPDIIPLWPEGVPGQPHAGTPPEETVDGRVSHVHVPTIAHYAPSAAANGTAIIICPGGGYSHLSMQHEGSVIAAWLGRFGVTTFVLKYRLGDWGHPAPLQDVLRAVRIVRSRAKEFGVDPDRIGVLGSSAGGHLTASAGTLFASPAGKTGAALDAVSARPDFIVLLYPVITMHDPFAHAGSRRHLLGDHVTPEAAAFLSVEEQVTAATPPAFIIHTQEDKVVPVENSLMFYQALRRAGVPAELHLYEKGPHGIGIDRGPGATAEWPKQAEAWLRARGLLSPKA